ncbi:MAG: O-antigen ligase family protein [Terriglobales bacterium]
MTIPLSTSRRPELAVDDTPSPRSKLRSTIFYGVFALLLLGPLAFGAVQPWSIFILEAASALLFILWIVEQFCSPTSTVRWNSLFSPMLVFASLVILQLAARRTAYPYATFSSGLLYVAYGVICFLVIQCFTRPSQVRILTRSFSSYGFVVAAFALLQGLGSNNKLYWLLTPRGGGWIYGPYVNHNHYAGLMEMLFPIPLVFSLTRYARGAPRRLAVLSSAVMATTIFLSGSRGGVIAFVCEIIVLLASLIRQQSRIPFRGRLAFTVFAVLLISFFAWIGSHKIAERLTSVHSARREITQGLRVQIDRDLLKMFPHRPLLGWGLGTFADVYPQYRSFYTSFYIDQAHNDYLQLLIEMGAIGFLTMMWFLWLVFREANRKLRNWSNDIDGAITLAAMLGVVGMLVHSLVDFNLQVPANAAIFYVLCVIAAMEPRFGRAESAKLEHAAHR